MPRFRFGTARDFCSVGGMTTTFVSMTHDLTWVTNRGSKTRKASWVGSESGGTEQKPIAEGAQMGSDDCHWPNTRTTKLPGIMGARGRGTSLVAAGTGPNFAADRYAWLERSSQLEYSPISE